MGLFRFGAVKSRDEKKWLERSKEMTVRIHVQDPSIRKKMEMIHFTEQDVKLIKAIQPFIEDNIDQLVQEFYSTILQVNELKEMIEKHSTIDRLRQTLRIHLIELFNGTFDQEFLEKRYRVAKTHYRIGLKSAWYMGAFQNVQNTLISITFNQVQDREEIQAILSVINKILSFEQQIVLEAYESENIQKLNEQFERGKLELQHTMNAVSEGLVSLVEQTQASVETLSSNMKDVSQTTIQSNEQATLTKTYANDGQQKLNELLDKIQSIEMFTKNMIESIHRLGESSNQISAVIYIVQEIAEQTNLLSLNSAIEAARAGEHGKGFAVVSQEVRKLAEQTKRSVTDIQALISTSNQYKEQVVNSLHQVKQAVQEGSLASAQTNESFQYIVQSIGQNSQIVLSVQEQMEDIIKVVNEIERATTEVSSSAEQLNKAAALA